MACSEEGKLALTLVSDGEIEHVLIEPTAEGVIINGTLLPGLSVREVSTLFFLWNAR